MTEGKRRIQIQNLVSREPARLILVLDHIFQTVLLAYFDNGAHRGIVLGFHGPPDAFHGFRVGVCYVHDALHRLVIIGS